MTKLKFVKAGDIRTEKAVIAMYPNGETVLTIDIVANGYRVKDAVKVFISKTLAEEILINSGFEREVDNAG